MADVDASTERAAEAAGARAAKRADVLAAAAREFNAHGIGRASFNRIARDIGLTRAALYYYVKDRQDLVRQCYERTCEVMAGDLTSAEATEGVGLDRLLGFLRLSLDPDRPTGAVLSELPYLTGPAHEIVAKAHGDNIGRLRAIVRGGVADGSLRACDDEAIAQAIFGVIAWIPLSVGWLEGEDPTYRGRTVQAVSDLVSDGVAANPTMAFVPPIGAAAFRPAPPAAFDREAQAEAKREQILATASALFNRKGVDGTSLDEIAAALGATKGAFYHYLDNRTELMTRCYARAFDLFDAFADAAERLGRNGLEKGLIGLHLNVEAQILGLAPLVQMIGIEALPATVRAELRHRSRVLQQRFTAFQLEGIAQGVTRHVDVDTLAQLSAGVFEWLPKWFDPADPRGGGALSAEYLRL
ncbi:MAG TPA: TetR/AcrR family transcriptional regulator, partial [Caulobacteraceae bacterium]|nr:TetR/AcrR family transcriptional regulator [Caulobacteraceae bacterium]